MRSTCVLNLRFIREKVETFTLFNVVEVEGAVNFSGVLCKIFDEESKDEQGSLFFFLKCPRFYQLSFGSIFKRDFTLTNTLVLIITL